jgi:hypothetical protein
MIRRADTICGLIAGRGALFGISISTTASFLAEYATAITHEIISNNIQSARADSSMMIDSSSAMLLLPTKPARPYISYGWSADDYIAN